MIMENLLIKRGWYLEAIIGKKVKNQYFQIVFNYFEHSLDSIYHICKLPIIKADRFRKS